MKLVWDDTGKKQYELGVDHGVIYPQKNDGTYESGVAWNGLTSVSENSEGGDNNTLRAHNSRYATRRAKETFSATVEAYTYPDEFEECDGSSAIEKGILITQQGRRKFGFTYRTLIGNDTEGQDAGYKLHIVWNARANPTEKGYGTVNESPDAVTFSWEVTSDGVQLTGYQDVASIVIDSTQVNPNQLANLENLLYGMDNYPPSLLSPAQVLAIFRFKVENLLDSSAAIVSDSGRQPVLGETAQF